MCFTVVLLTHRKFTKDLWNTQIADIREDIGYCFFRGY